MLSKLVIVFLPRSKDLLILWLQSLSAVILEPKKIKPLTVSIVSPSICLEVMGLEAMILVFWMLSFQPTFSLSSFTFINRLLSCSSLSAIRVVSCAYLTLLIFLPAILIPACASSSLAFRIMYSAYKLNKQGDNIQPWHTPFPIWSTQGSRTKANRVFPREHSGHSKHPLPTTQKKTLHIDITRWSIPKSDWLYSLQTKVEKLCTVSKNKTRSWLWLRSWTPYCQIQT